MDNPLTKAEALKGWMLPEELAWLYEAAQEMDSIVEIGSYKGRSTYALLSGCRGPVYAVDFFMCGKMFPYLDDDPDCYPEFMANVGHFSNLTVVRGTSAEAAVSDLIPPEIDMVFLDGCHELSAVLEDLNLWGPRTRKLVSGHDLDPGTPGVQWALEEFCQMQGVEKGPGTISFIRKAAHC